jgi:hypothetical protein
MSNVVVAMILIVVAASTALLVKDQVNGVEEATSEQLEQTLTKYQE